MIFKTAFGKLALMGLAIFAGFTASGFFNGPAPADEADKYQASIASLVSRYLELYHYQQYRLDDRLSKLVFENYLDSLDPQRVFFLQSDIDEFRKYEEQIDDILHANPAQLGPPLEIYARYRERVKERVAVALKLIDAPMNFDVEETMEFDRAKSPWAKSTAELDDLWRRRIKDERLSQQLRDTPNKDFASMLHKRYERLQKNVEDLETVDIVESFLNSLTTVYDPHSTYLKPASKDNFDIQMGHSLEGIGATLTTEAEYTKVSALVKGGPAERSGKIKVNDKIIAVAQGDGEMEDVIDMRIDKVVKKIRGPKGSKVRLLIIPNDAVDSGTTKEVGLIRDQVNLKSQDAKAEIKLLKDQDGKVTRLGVIEIPSFYLDTRSKGRGEAEFKSTTRDVRRLLAELEKKGIDGLAIDLRQNGGGSLDEAIQLTGLFIDHGPVVQVRDFAGKVDMEMDPDPAQIYKGPLVVLTSVFSASASEIFASALQDYGRGVIVGAKSTHGKGTVQNVASLQSQLARALSGQVPENIAGALKITTLKFYRISGGSTQFKGVEPDVVLPSPYDGLKVKEEDLPRALTWDEIDPIQHSSYDMVRQALPLLKANSAKRIANNPEFRYVADDTKNLLERRERNTLSLSLAKRKQEKEEDKAKLKAREEERKHRVSVISSSELLFPEEHQEEDVLGTEEPAEEKVKVPDFVLEESLLVLKDYITHKDLWVVGMAPKKDSL